MTTASELFHTRRSRSGRNGHFELVGVGEEEPPPPAPHSSHSDRIPNRRHHRRSYHHHNHLPAPTTTAAANARRDANRIQYDAYDPFNPGRAFHFSGPLGPARRTIPDRDSGLVDLGGSTTYPEAASSGQNGRTLGDRLRSIGGERLPGTVLLARERLLQRLRGVSISSNRQRNLVSTSSIHNNYNVTAEDDFRLANGVDWEHYDVSQEWFPGAVSFPDVFSVDKPRRPPGLTQEARGGLQVEAYSKLKKTGEEEVASKGLQECSVCLESYEEGDKLTYLTCGHRFHLNCLDPWLQICGDCPYCRKSILPNTM